MQRTIIFLTLAVMLAGCGGDRALSSQLGELDRALDQYGQAMRWGRYKDAERFQTTQAGDVIPIDANRMEPFRVTGNTILNKSILRAEADGDKPMEVEVTGEFQYYSTSSGTLRKAPYQQIWWFDSESKRWLVNGGVPEFK